MSVLIKKINDNDFEILSGSIDSDAFYLCLLALLMEVHIPPHSLTHSLTHNYSIIRRCHLSVPQ